MWGRKLKVRCTCHHHRVSFRFPAAFCFKEINLLFQQLIAALTTFLTFLPPPSSYGQPTVWSEFVGLGPVIWRPFRNRGLSLCTLHGVFREFTLEAARSEPDQKSSVLAIMMCQHMAENFDSELARTTKFNECTREFFGDWTTPKFGCAQLDAALVHKGVHILLRVDKLESGSTNSCAYLQNGRSFQEYIKDLVSSRSEEAQSFLSHGAPTFLVCVVGKQISSQCL
jgi:hypothetical protein